MRRTTHHVVGAWGTLCPTVSRVRARRFQRTCPRTTGGQSALWTNQFQASAKVLCLTPAPAGFLATTLERNVVLIGCRISKPTATSGAYPELVGTNDCRAPGRECKPVSRSWRAWPEPGRTAVRPYDLVPSFRPTRLDRTLPPQRIPRDRFVAGAAPLQEAAHQHHFPNLDPLRNIQDEIAYLR